MHIIRNPCRNKVRAGSKEEGWSWELTASRSGRPPPHPGFHHTHDLGPRGHGFFLGGTLRTEGVASNPTPTPTRQVSSEKFTSLSLSLLSHMECSGHRISGLPGFYLLFLLESASIIAKNCCLHLEEKSTKPQWHPSPALARASVGLLSSARLAWRQLCSQLSPPPSRAMARCVCYFPLVKNKSHDQGCDSGQAPQRHG